MTQYILASNIIFHKVLMMYRSSFEEKKVKEQILNNFPMLH